MESSQLTKQESVEVTIVGGGIAGLYAAYLLAQDSRYQIQVLDQSSDYLGGKIATRKIRIPDIEETFTAEFGPMRFELDLQRRLRKLAQHLGVGFKPFTPTTSPKSLVEYQLTEVEKSFKSVAELLEWSILKMFFEKEIGESRSGLPGSNDVGQALARIAKQYKNNVGQIGSIQLQWLQCYADLRLFVEPGSGTTMKLRSLGEIESSLDDLRLHQRLFGDLDPAAARPLLRDIGLWHGLSETVTPGAIAKIRDGGTFYHCVINNPSAVEWGIFWLRQASALGDLSTFEDGVTSLVDKLEEKLTTSDVASRVLVRGGQQVLQVEPGKRHTEVALQVVDRADTKRDPYHLRTDEVILALPQWPLQQLNEHFPSDVSARIAGVEPLNLLKAFVVTENPWWPHHLKAQSYAWVVPTRELHFFRSGEEDDCPRGKSPADPSAPCTCDQDAPGMIMLYTDQPSIHYWDRLIPAGDRGSVFLRHIDKTMVPSHSPGAEVAWRPEVEVDEKPLGLLDLLVRRLLVVPYPGLAYQINFGLPKVPEDIQNRIEARHIEEREGRGEPEPEELPDPEAVQKLLDGLTPGPLLGLSETIVRNWKEFSVPKRDLIEAALNVALDMKPPEWRRYVREFLKKRKHGISANDSCAKAKDIIAYGIRDWSTEPYCGAAHLWLPGQSYVTVKPSNPMQPESTLLRDEDPLLAFSLRERAGDGAPRNVHICGEAFSGNQGFIEGALETAEAVVKQIMKEPAFSAALERLAPTSPDEKRNEQIYLTIREHAINEKWLGRANSLTPEMRAALEAK